MEKEVGEFPGSTTLPIKKRRFISGNGLVIVFLLELGPILSHLFFADDSIMFLKATEQNCIAVESILTSYCHASGQVVNFEKSSVYFSPNTPHQLRENVGYVLHVNIIDNPGKYLGLPTM